MAPRRALGPKEESYGPPFLWVGCTVPEDIKYRWAWVSMGLVTADVDKALGIFTCRTQAAAARGNE